MAKATIKDIATRAGVSQAAVSMAIHGKKGISDSTRLHILRIAQELNYEPSNRCRPTAGAAALLIDTPEDDLMFFALQGLIRYACEQNIELKIFTLSQILDDPSSKLADCSFLVTFDSVDHSRLNLLSPLVPIIWIINGNYRCEPFLNIQVDYAGAAYSLTKYLKELGHRSFIYLNGGLPSSKNLICFNGFQRLIIEQRFPLNPEQIIMDVSSDPNIWSHLPNIIRANNVSAIVCTSDRAAVQAVDHLQAAGLHVPEDISVAAITDDGSTLHPGFKFTQVSLNVGSIGDEICRLTAGAKRPAAESELVIPVGPVIEGSSSGSPKFNPATKKLAIALYLKDHPTMRVARAGFLNKVQQMGYQAEVVGTPNGDDNSFAEVVKTLPGMNVDGVALWLAVPEAVRILSNAGIPVVCLHAIAEDEEKLGIRSNITEDPIAVAKAVANYFSQQLGGQAGSIAITQSGDNPLESGITLEFIRLMKASCPQITVLDDLQFAHHTAANTQLVADFIERTPDLLGAFTTAGDACANWAAAKKALGRSDMIIVGTDYTEEAVSLLENDEIQAFVAQPIYEEAQTSVVALDAILRGNSFPSSYRLEAPLATKVNVEKYARLLQEIRNWYV